MTSQAQRVIEAIELAFAGVRLEDGISLREAIVLDNHGTNEDRRRARAIAATALLEWTRGRCWLGRDPARGLGWMRLENLEVRVLKRKHARMLDNRVEAWVLPQPIDRGPDRCQPMPCRQP